MKIVAILIVLFLFFACSDDGPGFNEVDITAFVFNDTIVREIKITIDPQTFTNVVWNQYTNAGGKAYALATNFELDGEKVENIGIRSRGNFSLTNYKRQFKISFDCTSPYTNNQPGQFFTMPAGTGSRRFHGVKKINLRASHNDPTIIREKIASYICQKAGAVAPRVGFAKLYINNEYWGLYLITEQIDKTFLSLRFAEKGGNLYKGIGGAVFSPTFVNNFELKNNGKAAGDTSGLTTFFTDLASATTQSELEALVDMDNVINYLAAAVLIGHWDSFAWNPNNDYLYTHSDGKFRIINWDMDNTFGSGNGWGFDMRYAQYDKITTSGNWPLLFAKIMAVPALKTAYKNKVKSLLDSCFNAGHMDAVIDQYKNLIQTAVLDDDRKYVDWRYTSPAAGDTAWEEAFTQQPVGWTGTGFGSYNSGLKGWIADRHDIVSAMINGNPGTISLSFGAGFVTNNNAPTLAVGTEATLVCNASHDTGIASVGFSMENWHLAPNQNIWQTFPSDSSEPYTMTFTPTNAGWFRFRSFATNNIGGVQSTGVEDRWAWVYTTNYSSCVSHGGGSYTFYFHPDFYNGVSNQNVYIAGTMNNWGGAELGLGDYTNQYVLKLTNAAVGNGMLCISINGLTSGDRYKFTVDMDGDDQRNDDTDWLWDIANPNIFWGGMFDSLIP